MFFLEFILMYVVIGIIVTLVTGSIELGIKWFIILMGFIYTIVRGRDPFGED